MILVAHLDLGQLGQHHCQGQTSSRISRKISMGTVSSMIATCVLGHFDFVPQECKGKIESQLDDKEKGGGHLSDGV